MPGPGLLISVRSAEEASTALSAGAGLIDVKEPEAGGLGRASAAIVREVIAVVAGRRPISVALGELREEWELPPWGLAYAKWGLAGWCGRDWPSALARALDRLAHERGPCLGVPTAYADAERAQAPPVAEVVAFAVARRCAVLLVDTFGKDGSHLLDHASQDAIAGWARACRAAGVRLALAGSLRLPQIQQLRAIAPDWFAVRGAVCEGGDRSAPIDAQRARQMVRMVQGTTSAG